MSCSTILYKIEKINGNVVTFLKLKASYPEEWITAYVLIDKANPDFDYQGNEPYVTWQEGKVLGVDTAHEWNKEQTLEEKYEDAKQQIIDILEFFGVVLE